MSAIPHIPVEAPPASLLTVSRLIPGGFDAWRDGVTWQANSCNRSQGWSDCTDESRATEKCDPPDAVIPEFRPWTIYVPDGCSTTPKGKATSYSQRTSEVLEAYSAGAVSRELATAEFAPSNPSLEKAALLAVNPSPGALDILDAVQLLIQARITAGYYGVHVLHVPMWMIPGLDANYLLNAAGRAVMGNVLVSPGPGYPGRNPDSEGAPTDPAPGEGWLYISGPVEYGLGPVMAPQEPEETIDRRLNTMLAIAERMAIVRFDTCGVFAINAKVGG